MGESDLPLRIPDAYNLLDLGTLAGDTDSVPTDVNNRGEVVGTSYVDTNYALGRAFYWSEQQGMTEIMPMPGYDHIEPGHLNDRGELAGTLYSSGMDTRGFVWRGGRFELIEPPAGATITTASGINGQGDVVGGADFAGDGNLHAFVRDNGGPLIDLGLLTGGFSSVATDINGAEEIVGLAVNAMGDHVGVLWTDGLMVDLSSVLSVPGFLPFAITRDGEMAGYSYLRTHAVFVDDDMQAIDLLSLEGETGVSAAYDVNRAKQVVGASSVSDRSESHAFIWEDGQMVDLNDRIDSSSGVELTEATAINDRGQIVGVGMVGGEYHAFLLRPE